MTRYALVGPNGVDRIAEPGTVDPTVPTRDGWTWLEVVDEPMPTPGTLDVITPATTVENGKVLRGWTVTQRSATSVDVDLERDRRMAVFTFGGTEFDFDATSRVDIAGAGILAFAAIVSGAQPGDLRWSDPDEDFAWIARDNSRVPMDAQTCFAFGQAAAKWRSDLIFKARALKDAAPIPSDYAADAHWA